MTILNRNQDNVLERKQILYRPWMIIILSCHQLIQIINHFWEIKPLCQYTVVKLFQNLKEGTQNQDPVEVVPEDQSHQMRHIFSKKIAIFKLLTFNNCQS